jgi:anti-anti-sigma factor
MEIASRGFSMLRDIWDEYGYHRNPFEPRALSAGPRFEATVRSEPHVAVIDLRGDVDGDSEEALKAAYAEARAIEPRTILLNFSEVEYINSTGIALIVGLLAQARARDVEVRATGLSDHYREIFEITRLADFMTIEEEEDHA